MKEKIKKLIKEYEEQSDIEYKNAEIFEKEGMEVNRRDSVAEGFTYYKVAKDLKRLLLEVEGDD